VVRGNYAGAVTRAPTSLTGESDGAYPRFWLSEAPKGAPISIKCSQVTGSERDFRWYQTGSDGSGCEIPDTPAVYYLNWTRCGLPITDLTCSQPGTPPAKRTVETYLRGVGS